MTTLEERLQARLKDWAKLARRFRIAQDECDDQSEEWYLNKENAEMIERLSLELAGDLSVHELMTPKSLIVHGYDLDNYNPGVVR
jgi:hypothetical protein